MPSIGAHEQRALTPLFWTHISPYGRFQLNMTTRLDLNNHHQRAFSDLSTLTALPTASWDSFGSTGQGGCRLGGLGDQVRWVVAVWCSLACVFLGVGCWMVVVEMPVRC